MNTARIHIIAAVASGNRALGKDNNLIYRIRDDLKRFKALTTGHPVIMGRKTFESIGTPLRNRTNIVITSDPAKKIDGCVMARSLDDALQKAGAVDTEIFIIGGERVFREALPIADILHLTIVEGSPEADVFFPEYSEFSVEIFKEDHPENDPPYYFVDLKKNKSS